MFGILGGLIAQGRDYRELFEIVRPDLGRKGVVAGFSKEIGDGYLYEDLYPDAVPCLNELKERGYFVGIAGNQPANQERNLEAMNLHADLIATSGGFFDLPSLYWRTLSPSFDPPIRKVSLSFSVDSVRNALTGYTGDPTHPFRRTGGKRRLSLHCDAPVLEKSSGASFVAATRSSRVLMLPLSRIGRAAAWAVLALSWLSLGLLWAQGTSPRRVAVN